jgi:hypothetical protein
MPGDLSCSESQTSAAKLRNVWRVAAREAGSMRRVGVLGIYKIYLEQCPVLHYCASNLLRSL